MVLALGIAAAVAQAATTADTFNKTTVQRRIIASPGDGFQQLKSGPGEAYVVRQEDVGKAKKRRAERRTSLAYFGQLSDFQLADEESPARVEFTDSISETFGSAFRPWEPLEPQIDDAMIRQMNSFANAGPVKDGSGSGPKMGFAIDTGDSADSQQLNETQWVKTLLEGGKLDPNSGIDPTGYTSELCPPSGVPGAAEAAQYTGVQDFNDYIEGPNPSFYDPNSPAGTIYGGFPTYPGLMNQSEKSFTAAGLKVPSYVTFGNHDALVQGNAAATTTFEKLATGCIKPMVATFPGGNNIFGGFTVQNVLDLHTLTPDQTMLVPPDPARSFVSKKQFKQSFIDGDQADGHGFGKISQAENAASNGAAGYYSFKPRPGIRMISLDTVSEGGVILVSSEGNVDDPQYRWLENQLKAATRADELVILFSHHGIDSLNANVPDEVAPACTAPDAHGHDVNPGCDLDPRSSEPIHLGADMVALLHKYPHVVAWIAGHSHVNRVQPYPDGKGGGFWMVKVAAEADWPQQARLLQLFDNQDGSLSLFGTIIDHASNATASAPGTAASGLDTKGLASIGRTLSYNDPQVGAKKCAPVACGEGTTLDRNVELLITDPRRGPGPLKSGRCANKQLGTPKRDVLRGTKRGDRLRGFAGRDLLVGRAGRDCLDGGRGNDRILARGGGRDSVVCGAGNRDVAVVDRRDRVRGCEIVRLPKKR